MSLIQYFDLVAGKLNPRELESNLAKATKLILGIDFESYSVCQSSLSDLWVLPKDTSWLPKVSKKFILEIP